MTKQIQKPLYSFLQNPMHQHAVQTAIQSPSLRNQSYVNQLFYQYQIEARFVSYVNTTLWRAAKDFHKKRRNWTGQHMWEIETIAITDHSADIVTRLTKTNLLASLENPELHQALQQLSERQQMILYEYAVELSTFKEIAEKLDVSQQSVSKVYQRVVIRLRHALKGGE
ncbi:sigma-70 family RNA polymerase sigma factor [Halobacillus seohaensis]|uniref:Sigma-70 family RNA polymerase sigma factor n=1 Tax=Halobacillus seohaensis TaxID=447421 RepID=A0ABW2EHU7_9BACI